MGMATAGSEANSKDQLADIPWADVVRFVRQLSHDLRNHLNAAELQSAYIGEIATDPEVKDEVKRLRVMMAELGSVLQKLSADMGPARSSMISYNAADFLKDIRQKLEAGAGREKLAVRWDVQVGDVNLEVDPQLLPLALQELLSNASRHGSIGENVTLSASIDDKKQVVLELKESKMDFELSTENWGREPLRKIGQGHYGLGLNRARTIIESHGGRLEARYDGATKSLVTKVTLPISAGAG
jgi:signal transduction histidine kinase